MDDTPLGRVVEIRSTTDKERLKNMTAAEKRIRSEWKEFRKKSEYKFKDNKSTMSVSQFQKLIEGLVGGS